MSEKRFGTKIDDVDSSIIVITDKCNDFAWFLSDVITDKQVEKVVALLNALDRDCNNLRIEKLQFENKCTTLEGENEQLKNYFKKRAECSNFQINKLKEEIAELQEDNVDTIVELSKENEQLRKQNNKYVIMMNNNAHLNEMLKEENGQLRQEIVHLKDDLQYYKTKSARLEEELLSTRC